MMIHQAGRTVIRSHSIPCYFISTRVSPLLSISLRVSAKYYAKYSSDFLLRTQATARQFSGQRTYATRPVSRPKAHTGRITASPRTKKTQKVVVEGEALVKEGTDTVATPKSTPKSKPKTKASRKFSSNTTPKSKPKRKVKAKAKPKRKVKAKEPLTEEGKAAAAVKEKRKQIRELKVTALNVPKLKPSTVWSLVNEEVTKEKRRLAASDASDMYRNLIPEEIEVCASQREVLHKSLTFFPLSITTKSRTKTRRTMQRHTRVGFNPSPLTISAKPTTRVIS